jgi:hypothetical protein
MVQAARKDPDGGAGSKVVAVAPAALAAGGRQAGETPTLSMQPALRATNLLRIAPDAACDRSAL